METDIFCGCTRSAPWPVMERLHVAMRNRYYLCPMCKTIREELYDDLGAMVKARWYAESDWGNLPDVVVELARRLLERPRYEQLQLM